QQDDAKKDEPATSRTEGENGKAPSPRRAAGGERTTSAQPGGERAGERVPPPGALAGRGMQLDLRTSPARTLLADGRDAATVQVWTQGDTTSDVRVRFYKSGGALAPEPLVIPRGEPVGEAKLTSDHPGDVVVEM